MFRRRSLAEDDAFEEPDPFPPEASKAPWEFLGRLLGFGVAALPLAWLGLLHAYAVSIRLDAGRWPRRPSLLSTWHPWGGWPPLIRACRFLDPLVLSVPGALIFVAGFLVVLAATGRDLESRKWRTALVSPLLWLVSAWMLALALRLADPGGFIALFLAPD